MKLTTREIILCGLFAALVSIFAQISIPLPFTTVPLTLQMALRNKVGYLLLYFQ